MEKFVKQRSDNITPDALMITELRISLYHSSSDALCISFDGRTAHIGNYCTKHPGFHRKLKTDSLQDFRLWYKEKLLSMWIHDEKKDIASVFKSLKEAFDSGNIVLYHIDDLKKVLPNGLDDISIIFTKVEHGVEYIVKCGFDELDKIDGVQSNSIGRMFHLMVPTEKKHYFEINPEARSERRKYFEMGERAWVKKHGNIDPALYHLIMYEE